MLLEIAIGDAYGAAFEMAPMDYIIKYNNGVTYHKHPWHTIKPGCYTDDTQMSIALAELMLEKDTKDWTTLDIADKFVKCFHRDPREGYSKSFYGFLQRTKTAEVLLRDINPSSDKNGAAMRSVPLGLLPDIKEAARVAALQASITHDTIIGKYSSQLVAIAAHLAYYYPEEQDCGHEKLLDDAIVTLAQLGFPFPKHGEMHPTLMLCMKAIRIAESSDIIKNSCRDGGDVDTLCAIAYGVYSLSLGLNSGNFNHIRNTLLTGLENTTYGFHYLMDLDAKLANKFPRLGK